MIGRLTAALLRLLFPAAAHAPAARPTVAFIATGGTIAMKIDPRTGAPVPAIDGDDLMRAAPGMARHASVEVRNLCNLQSAAIGPETWVALTAAVRDALARDEVAGAVVSHGTDTLEETAWWLDLTVCADKPVVLTGAQRNASAPDFDGPRNLEQAVRIAVDPGARGKGVLVALNGRINAARDATKTHTSNVETFLSGDAGTLGEVGPERVVWFRAPLRRQCLPLADGAPPRVDIVPMYGGADGALLRAAVAAGARGIVVQALGMGNVNPALFDAIREALAAGVAVAVSTRVPRGAVAANYGYPGGGKTLADAGAVMAGDLPPHKARILLMLLLWNGVSAPQALQEAFDR